MRFFYLTLILLIVPCAWGADRRKPQIDPESQEGILLQRILQEPTPLRKLILLEQFVGQFPKAPAIAWIDGQLLPIYLDNQQFDKALTAAEGLLASDADDLDAAYGALRAIEGKKDAELAARYAPLSWDVASKVAQTPEPAEKGLPEAPSDWTRRTALARDVMIYAEYVLYSRAKECTDLEKKSRLVQALEARNPQSRYLSHAKDELLVAVESGGSTQDRLALAEKTLAQDPENEDALLMVAQYDLQHERDLPKVLSYSVKVIERVQQKPQPDDLTPEVWMAKKARYAGLANWMAGVVLAQQGQWQQSERYLRAAVPNLHEVAMLAAAYYYLGYDNYALAAQQRDDARIADSLKYSKLCAGMQSPFQGPAQKNLEVLKNQFNVE